MADWVHIENDVIDSYEELPINWRNISNFYMLKEDLNFLKSINWYPVTKLEYQFDPTKQKLDNRRFLFDGNTVTEEYDIVDIPQIPVPTVDDVEKVLANFVKGRLDDFAKSKQYDNILSACSYVNDSNQKYHNEAVQCINLRSLTWDKFSKIMDDIKLGIRPIPNSSLDIENELPKLEWLDTSQSTNISE